MDFYGKGLIFSRDSAAPVGILLTGRDFCLKKTHRGLCCFNQSIPADLSAGLVMKSGEIKYPEHKGIQYHPVK